MALSAWCFPVFAETAIPQTAADAASHFISGVVASEKSGDTLDEKIGFICFEPFSQSALTEIRGVVAITKAAWGRLRGEGVLMLNEPVNEEAPLVEMRQAGSGLKTGFAFSRTKLSIQFFPTGKILWKIRKNGKKQSSVTCYAVAV
ncbi:hypothetical protein ACVCGZ_05555 [Serratia nematodiphila]